MQTNNVWKYSLCCSDNTPMVRRAAAKTLGEFATNIKNNDTLVKDVMPLIDRLLHDENTAIQEITVDHIPTISKLLNEKFEEIRFTHREGMCLESELETKTRCCERYALDCCSVGKDTAIESIVPMMRMLLADTEREVTCAGWVLPDCAVSWVRSVTVSCFNYVSQISKHKSRIAHKINQVSENASWRSKTQVLTTENTNDMLKLLNDSNLRNRDTLAEAGETSFSSTQRCDPVLDFMQLEEWL